MPSDASPAPKPSGIPPSGATAPGARLARLAQHPACVGVACGLAALVVYVVSAAPGINWQDSALHQFRVFTGRLENPLGLALTHPLHYWLGRAVLRLPLNPAYGLNLLSALCGAAGIGLLAATITSLTRCAPAAVLGAATTALSFSYWQMSAITETYTLAAALMMLEWLLLLAYTRSHRPQLLAGVFAVNGFHVANHLLGLLPLSAYGILALDRLARRKLSPRDFGLVLAAWAVAAAPYWSLAVEHYWHTGSAFVTLKSALFGGMHHGDGFAKEVLNVRLSWDQLKLSVWVLGYNFPSLGTIVALLGFLRRPEADRVFCNAMRAVTVIIALFVLRYPILDHYTFYTPLCACVGLWFGVEAARVLRGGAPGRRRWLAGALVASPLAQVACYFAFPPLAERVGFMRHLLNDLPYRNEYKHFFEPWKTGDNSPELYAAAVLGRMAPGDVYIGSGTTAYAVAAYAALHGAPPEIEIFSWSGSLTRPERGPMEEEPMRDEVRRLIARGSRIFADSDLFVVYRFDDERPPRPGQPPRVEPGFRIDRSSEIWEVVWDPPSASQPGGRP